MNPDTKVVLERAVVASADWFEVASKLREAEDVAGSRF